jgi:tripartite-type tricarboxylate transporter receptor subunit TctC
LRGAVTRGIVKRATLTRGAFLRSAIVAAALACGANAVAATAAVTDPAAKPWQPDHAIRFLVPYGPGGSSDVIARAMAVEMSRGLGQQMVVENKAGGQGTIAMMEAARAAPDGYTVILGHVGTLAVNPAMMAKLPYNVEKDFEPVSLLAKVAMVFAVGSKVPAKTLPEFIALAKSEPGKLNYGSAGNGSAGNLAFEMLKVAADIDVVHIPYKGTGQQITDLLAGNTDAGSAGPPGLMPHLAGGKIRILATGSAKRLPGLPDVPTVAESGYPGFESSQWFGLLVPAGTPPAVVARLHDEAVKALNSPAVRQRLEADSSEPVGSTPEEFRAFIRTEAVRWGDVVRKAHLHAE